MKLLARFLPPILVMAGIFYFSARTGDDLDGWLPFFQKWLPGVTGFDWGHFIAYFGLGLAFVWSLGGPRPSWRVLVAAVGLSLLYGVTDEYHQTFVEGRMADWRDLRNDGIGAAAACLFIKLPLFRRLYARLPHQLKGFRQQSGGNNYYGLE